MGSPSNKQLVFNTYVCILLLLRIFTFNKSDYVNKKNV